MNNLESLLLPYIFMILFGMIILNLLMNISLFSFTRLENVKLLCWYWGSLLLTYVFQGFFQTGQLSIVLSYSSNVIPVIIMAIILYNIMKKELPLKFFFLSWLTAVLLTPILHFQDYSFTVVAMPLSVAMGIVPLRTAWEFLFKDKKSSTPLQKFMGVLLLLTTVHFINFALFRMGEGNQLWGWSASLALYQVFSVLSFALVIENQSQEEKGRLEGLVDSRTRELSETLRIKNTLFRMVLHDIATPIQGQLLLLSRLERSRSLEEAQTTTAKLSELTLIVKKVIEQVRAIEVRNIMKIPAETPAVKLDECLAEIKTIFDTALTEKNIQLKVVNHLAPETTFTADPTIFTNSILGNLISNAIKFSLPNSVLVLNAYEKNNKVFVEILDHGVGMSEEVAVNIFNPGKLTTRPGTRGEMGSGFGMGQVKSFLEQFGGEIELTSKTQDMDPVNHGTQIKLTMEKSLGHLQ